MNTNPFLALDPLGQSLLAYWKGNQATQLKQEFSSGRDKLIPVSVFFRSAEDFYPTEQVLDYCRGRILVVGAGAGVHVLELVKRGFQVTAVEVNPQAVQIMRERGVTDVRHCDFFEFSGEVYDTILMLGHNIGMCGTLDRLHILLKKCKSLLHPGGQLLANSIDETLSAETSGNAGYPGEQVFRLSYNGEAGPWMRWLHIDFATLSQKASECEWSVRQLAKADDGEFLAQLIPRQLEK